MTEADGAPGYRHEGAAYPWSRGETRDHSGLIAHQIVPPEHSRRLPRPVPARCTALSYGRGVVTVQGAVGARHQRWLLFTADYPGWGIWHAWVSRDSCTPLNDPGDPPPQ